MVKNNHIKTYSNIITKKVKNNVVLDRSMIVHKELVKIKKNGEKVFTKTLNVDFWKHVQQKEGAINVTLDEAHTLFNSRRAMSDDNKVLSDFVALLRRVIGSSESGYGTLTFITQLERRLDVIALEMATNIRYHVCHYEKHCASCGRIYCENNESADPIMQCVCGSYKIKKQNHVIEVWEFKNIDLYRSWFFYGKKTYFKRYKVLDIEKVFPMYNTLQWENLISE